MSVWLGILLLSLFCLLLIVWAGYKNVTVVRRNPIDFYKAQLAEIEADIDTSMISKEDAETATLEIKRRLIKSGERDAARYRDNEGSLIFYGLGALIIAGSIGLYTIVGKPEIASSPSKPPEMLDRQIDAGSGLTFKQAITGIKLRLEEDPSSAKGWAMLGITLSQMGRYNEAAEAYGHAVELEPDNAEYQIKFGEQITAMHGGMVVPAASKVFQKVLKLEPDYPSAHFYLGLAQKQAGNKEDARSIWQGLLDRSAPDAPWAIAVKRQISGLNPAPRLSGGPTSDDIRAVQNMSPEEQAAFIESMLERLRAKLKENPSDAKGWIMLARSEEQRGNIKAAIEVLEEAVASVSDEDRAPLELYLEKLKN